MSAWDYYCKKWDVTDPNIIGLDQIEFAEEYYQAKSKEEAEERYEKGVELWNNQSGFIMPKESTEFLEVVSGHKFTFGKDES